MDSLPLLLLPLQLRLEGCPLLQRQAAGGGILRPALLQQRLIRGKLPGQGLPGPVQGRDPLLEGVRLSLELQIGRRDSGGTALCGIQHPFHSAVQNVKRVVAAEDHQRLADVDPVLAEEVFGDFLPVKKIELQKVRRNQMEQIALKSGGLLLSQLLPVPHGGQRLRQIARRPCPAAGDLILASLPVSVVLKANPHMGLPVVPQAGAVVDQGVDLIQIIPSGRLVPEGVISVQSDLNGGEQRGLSGPVFAADDADSPPGVL